jgi:hypothetical protein
MLLFSKSSNVRQQIISRTHPKIAEVSYFHNWMKLPSILIKGFICIFKFNVTDRADELFYSRS